MIFIVTVVVYLAILVAISIYKSRSVKTQDDFMVAGRKVTWYFLVGTLVCTWIGSGSLFGGAGRAFREGFSALWMSAGAWVGIAIVYFLAGRGTLAIIIAYLTIASYQFIGGGRLLSLLFPGLDPAYGQLIICGLVVIYTIMAGMMSIVTLDVFNGLMIIGSILIAAPLTLAQAGGWSGLTATLPETHDHRCGHHRNAHRCYGDFRRRFILDGSEIRRWHRQFYAGTATYHGDHPFAIGTA